MRKTSIVPVLLAGSLVLGGCKKREVRPLSAEAPPVRVETLRVEPQPFAITVPITGTLVSTAKVEVKAETTGKVLKFPKEEGDTLRAGEAVIWVDDTYKKLAVQQAEAALQTAEAALERAKVLEAHNRSEYVRAQNLLKSGGITDRDYRAAELADRDARAQVALAAAQLAQARTQLEHARKALADTIVYAPIDGEIQAKLVRPGAYVEPPTAVFVLVDNARLELESHVATGDLGSIRPQQTVNFTVNAFPNETFRGRVIEISPAVQTDSRSAKVRIRVENPDRRLRAGMFAQGAILTGVNQKAIVIPAAAVYRDDRTAKSSYVFVVENGTAQRRNVRIGRERDSAVEIVEGLKPGDVVVAQQSIEIAEGVRVATQPPGETAGAVR